MGLEHDYNTRFSEGILYQLSYWDSSTEEFKTLTQQNTTQLYRWIRMDTYRTGTCTIMYTIQREGRGRGRGWEKEKDRERGEEGEGERERGREGGEWDIHTYVPHFAIVVFSSSEFCVYYSDSQVRSHPQSLSRRSLVMTASLRLWHCRGWVSLTFVYISAMFAPLSTLRVQIHMLCMPFPVSWASTCIRWTSFLHTFWGARFTGQNFTPW